jgi:hypothetical protein
LSAIWTAADSQVDLRRHRLSAKHLTLLLRLVIFLTATLMTRCDKPL